MSYRFCILILIFLSSLNLKADYILVEVVENRGGWKVIDTNYDSFSPKVWEILNTLQFPQNMNQYFRKKFNISPSQYQILINREYEFLINKIEEFLPPNRNFDLIYVPTTIMEIFSSKKGLQLSPLDKDKFPEIYKEGIDFDDFPLAIEIAKKR